MKSNLQEYFDRLEATLHLAFLETRREVRKKSVHELRVALKRYKAFLQLLAATDPHFPLEESLDRLRAVFKKAGKLRNAEIEWDLLLDADPKAARKLQKKVDKYQKSFESFELAYSLADIREISAQVRAYMQGLTEPAIRDRIRTYLYQQAETILLLGENGLAKKSRLHELRTHLKELLYNLEVLSREKAPVLKQLDELQNALGKWHDLEITRQIVCDKNLEKTLRQAEKTYLIEVRSSLSTLPGSIQDLLLAADQLFQP